MSSAGAERLLALTLASSAGIHAALVPTHAAETPLLGALFALSALLLAALTVGVAHAPGAVALGAAGLLLGALLVAYVAARFVALPPLTHSEPVDVLGVATKLIEAGGLVLALRLLGTRAGGAALPALHEGAGQ
ncbi:MAG TPA: hypothetical protein VE449_02725 [Thermoleophilaceae bacterium]|jgi:hypothetical protein|nr:hypothetical protein [Thermoleophilaceae bacterium]